MVTTRRGTLTNSEDTPHGHARVSPTRVSSPDHRMSPLGWQEISPKCSKAGAMSRATTKQKSPVRAIGTRSSSITNVVRASPPNSSQAQTISWKAVSRRKHRWHSWSYGKRLRFNSNQESNVVPLLLAPAPIRINPKDKTRTKRRAQEILQQGSVEIDKNTSMERTITPQSASFNGRSPRRHDDTVEAKISARHRLHSNFKTAAQVEAEDLSLYHETLQEDVDKSDLATRLRKVRKFFDPLQYDPGQDTRPAPRLDDFHEARAAYQKHWNAPEVRPYRFPEVDEGYDEEDIRQKSYYEPNPSPSTSWERRKLYEYHLQRSARKAAFQRKRVREAAQREARRRSRFALHHQQPQRRQGALGPLGKWTSLANDARRAAAAKQEAAEFGVTTLIQIIEALKDVATGNSMYRKLPNGFLVDVPALLEWQWAFSNEVLRPNETFESYFGYRYEDAVPTDWPLHEGRSMYDLDYPA